MAGGADPAVSERAWLAAVCASELGTLLVFSNFSALLPLLQREWDLSNSQAGLIVSFYQFGYIGAVMILATLTDYMPPRRIYLWSAFWMAAASFAFAFWAQGFLSAVILRGAVGLGFAGTYMPGMRMVAERFASGRRGFAMGCYIGTFTLGTSLSLLLTGWANGHWGWRAAFALTAVGPLAAGVIGWLILPRTMAAAPPAQRPLPAEKRVERLGPVLQNRAALRLITAYAAHTFELMGMRGWIVPFFTASLIASGAELVEANQRAALAASAVLAIGALPHPFSGLLSDRFGRAMPISALMLLSACCSFAIGSSLTSQRLGIEGDTIRGSVLLRQVTRPPCRIERGLPIFVRRPWGQRSGGRGSGRAVCVGRGSAGASPSRRNPSASRVLSLPAAHCPPPARSGRQAQRPPLLEDGATVLTHCNAGALATAGYGTALAIVRAAV